MQTLGISAIEGGIARRRRRTFAKDDTKREKGFIWMTRKAEERVRDLPKSTRLVYQALCSIAKGRTQTIDGHLAKRAHIAKRAGVSERSVMAAIRALSSEEISLIRVTLNPGKTSTIELLAVDDDPRKTCATTRANSAPLESPKPQENQRSATPLITKETCKQERTPPTPPKFARVEKQRGVVAVEETPRSSPSRSLPRMGDLPADHLTQDHLVKCVEAWKRYGIERRCPLSKTRQGYFDASKAGRLASIGAKNLWGLLSTFEMFCRAANELGGYDALLAKIRQYGQYISRNTDEDAFLFRVWLRDEKWREDYRDEEVPW